MHIHFFFNEYIRIPILGTTDGLAGISHVFNIHLQHLLSAPLSLRHLFIRRIILGIRKPPGPRIDPASSYVALSRATSLDDIHLLFPVNLTDLTRPRNQDVVAFIEFLQRLEEASISAFNLDPSTFTPTSASLPLSSDDSDGHESITTAPRGGTRRARSHRSQQRSPTPPAYLIPNRDNNCFLNAALCLALAAFDGQSLPDSSNCTPAAAAFFFALVMIKDKMFEGNPLPQHVLVRFHQESITVGHMHLFQSTQSSPCTTINICANSLNFQFPHRSFSGHRC